MPSEAVVQGDNTAGLSFRLVNAAPAATYQVFVDGLLMGNAQDFKEGVALLRILPGSHVVRVESAGQVILEEKLYVAAGANKVLVVK